MSGRGGMLCGGIDLGGTKIEARLFDGRDAHTVDVVRIPTPKENFEAMIGGLAEAFSWLETTAGGAIPVGLAVPGIVDPRTGESFASNIPATGRAIAPALAEACGRTLPVINDCMAFAYSEAHGGAGEGAHTVMGLIIGTGVGGGVCIDGQMPHRHAGLAVEIGHVGTPQRVLDRHGLPVWPCGCGRSACFENYMSGTGLANLAEWKLGARISAHELAQAGTEEADEILSIWADLTGECLDTIQLMLDPDCIVLGGGLSNLPGVERRLTDALAKRRLGRVRLPSIRRARHGDSSGARGAALLARDTS